MASGCWVKLGERSTRVTVASHAPHVEHAIEASIGEGQRVLLEPSLMQLRFGEEPVKPRFDLELVGGDTIIVKTSFERTSDKRRFSLMQGGWFEGWPSWQIDTQEGIARRVDKRVSPAAMTIAAAPRPTTRATPPI